jgi:hypothetical protein
MFSWFYGSQPAVEKTRLNTSQELKQIETYLSDIKNKKEELERASKEKGVNSLDHKKFKIMSSCYDELTALVTVFNQRRREADQKVEAHESMVLVREMGAVLVRNLQDRAILISLATFRDNRRHNANMATHFGIVGGSVVIAAVSGGASVFWTIIGSVLISDVVREKLSMSNQMPRSLQIIANFMEQLKKSATSLAVILNVEMSVVSHYDVLGVPVDATTQQITAAYRGLAIIFHPDKPTGNTEKFQEISNAYEALVDPAKRKAYDLSLGDRLGKTFAVVKEPAVVVQHTKRIGAV